MQVKDQLEEQTWDISRVYLREALEYMLEAGRGVRELSEFALDRFGADFLPYLRQFLHEVGHGRISVKGLGRTARSALSGHSVSSEERDRMIREVAYLRAERRGFCGGSPEDDWLAAEREVDLCLAQGPGLVVSGTQALSVALAAAQEEPAGRRDSVDRWLADRFAAPEKADGKKAVRARKSRSGTAPAIVPETAAPEGSTGRRVKKKPAVRKTAAAKKAVTKQPAATTKKSTATRKPAATKKAASAKKTAAAKKTGGTKKRVAAARRKTASGKRTTGGRTAATRRSR